MIFAVPRAEVVYLGTTDTNYLGDKSEPEISLEDVNYILAAVNNMFPQSNLSIDDVESSWAGLRPLIHENGKSPSELSRKDEIFVAPSGLISIAGGKLTGYRKMAERLVDLVIDKLNIPAKKCITDKIQLVGGKFENYEAVQGLVDQLYLDFQSILTSRNESEYLVYNYGSDARTILNAALKIEESPSLAIALAEAEFTIENEMVESSLDFFVRRTGRLHFNIESVRVLRERITDFMAVKLNWSPERKHKESKLLDLALQRVAGFRSKLNTPNL